MNVRATSVVLSMVFTCSLIAQNSVGLLSYDLDKVSDGYTLIYPHNQPNVYLLDNCGAVVHVWEDEPNYRPGNTAYLLENGNLVKTKRDMSVLDDAIWAGGGGAIVEIRSWDNELLWSFAMNDSLRRLHHDIAPMPNGNILMIAWEKKTAQEAIDAGRDPDLLVDGELWPDFILEVRPVGTDSAEIVWEWHTWDHLIQDFDPTKDNYGIVAEHPELININYIDGDAVADWMHSNALDYNPRLDQVMLCSPDLSEIWIIDHTTTTEEAASHAGGLSGRGGDLMYRFGNHAVYDQGTEEDQLLFFPHDAHWIDDFVPETHPYYNMIAVYNNRAGAEYSAVNVIRQPVFDDYMWWYPMTGDIWGPTEFEWQYVHPDTVMMHSTGLSSVQHLANGNTLVCSGRFGYIFEITADEEIIWEYRTPLRGGVPVPQGDTLNISENLTFRANRYPADYGAFDGRNLTGQGYIELNPDTTFCNIIAAVDDPDSVSAVRIYPNPAFAHITLEAGQRNQVHFEILDLTGVRVLSGYVSGLQDNVDIGNLPPGLYLVHMDGKGVRKLVVQR